MIYPNDTQREQDPDPFIDEEELKRGKLLAKIEREYDATEWWERD